MKACQRAITRIHIKGVNLGGWLVLEKWITPSLFARSEVPDEFNLHKSIYPDLLKKHYETFITESDFKFLSENNVNAVRIPVGYWLFGDSAPYPKTINYLDSAMEYAEKYKIKVLIDLHAAPGSQNGYDHSGKTGIIEWHTNKNYINATLDIIEKISLRYNNSPAFYGIELLNEPHINIPMHLLINFYVRGYEIVRNICGEKVAVIVSDAFRPNEMKSIFNAKKYKNVFMDVHFYQCFTDSNKNIGANKFCSLAGKEWARIIRDIQRHIPVLVGEWSMAMNANELASFDNHALYDIYKQYAATQKEIFSQAVGWFFWTYKTEDAESYWWNFKGALKNGVIGPI